MTQRRNPEHLTGRSRRTLERVPWLPMTADQSRGSSNLATIPRTGDLIVLDNMLVAHARRPFEGSRKILVAMGDMTSTA